MILRVLNLYVAEPVQNEVQGNSVNLFFLILLTIFSLSAQDAAVPTTVIQVAQVLVIDQKDVLSIAADMAVAAAMAAAAAAAAEDETVSSDSIGLVETSGDQQSVSIIEEETAIADVVAGKDVADGIAAGEIVGKTAKDDAVASSAVGLDDELDVGEPVSENADAMLQQQANTVSTSDVASDSIMTGSEFTFSPITLAPESSRSVRHSSKATQKPSAHVTPPAVVAKAKSAATSSSLSIYWTASFILSLCLIG